MQVKDLLGQQFGKLKVVAQAKRRINGHVAWVCKCTCGRRRVFPSNNLRSGNSTQCNHCGAVQRGTCNGAHRHSRRKHVTAEYIAWRNMKLRCTRLSHPSYQHYGAKGITVSPRWLDDFEAFLQDMGHKPSMKHSLERKDPQGNYEPSNCIWATSTEQNRNRGDYNRRLTLNGETLTQAAWAARTGIKATTIHWRLTRLGWSVEKALTTSVRST